MFQNSQYDCQHFCSIYSREVASGFKFSTLRRAMVVTHASVTGTGMCHRAFCTDPRGCQRLPWRSTARPEHVSDRSTHRSVDPAHTWVKDFAKKSTHSTLRNIKLSVPSAKPFPHMWTTAVHAQRQRNCEVARCQFRSLEHKTLHLISAQ